MMIIIKSKFNHITNIIIYCVHIYIYGKRFSFLQILSSPSPSSSFIFNNHWSNHQKDRKEIIWFVMPIYINTYLRLYMTMSFNPKVKKKTPGDSFSNFVQKFFFFGFVWMNRREFMSGRHDCFFFGWATSCWWQNEHGAK